MSPHEIKKFQAFEKQEKPGQILDYAPFDPGEELAKIRKFTPEEREKLSYKERIEIQKERLDRFKKELIKQRKGITDLQIKLEKYIRAEPNSSLCELLKVVSGERAELRLSDKQIAQFRNILKRYIKIHQSVKEYRKNYPDDKELYKALFKREPKGKIEVWESPITFYFRCFNIKDFVWVTRGDDTARDIRDLAEVQGQAILLDENGFAITLENTSTTETVCKESCLNLDQESRIAFEHEEGHTLQQLLRGKNLALPLFIDCLKSKTDKKSIEAAIEEYFRLQRKEIESDAQDEILAFFKSMPIEKLEEKIIAGHYALMQISPTVDAVIELLNYWLKAKGEGTLELLRTKKIRILELLRIKKLRGIEFERVRTEIIRKSDEIIKEKYKQHVKEGIKALGLLLKSGYTKEEIITLLNVEPLDHWLKLAYRLTTEL